MEVEIEVKKPLIIADVRENKEALKYLEELGAVVRVKQLEVGDFLCSQRVAVERKRFADFENSIIDGRLFKQLKALCENYERPVVVVEGKGEGRISREALLGAYGSIIADYGASLLFTQDIKETLEIVYGIAKHEQCAKKQPLRVFARKKALTPSQQIRGIVESFPLIGPKTAQQIMLHFGTLGNLFSASEKEIAGVRGVGKKRAKLLVRLLKYGYKKEEDEI